jgi:hypothetical protein
MYEQRKAWLRDNRGKDRFSGYQGQREAACQAHANNTNSRRFGLAYDLVT